MKNTFATASLTLLIHGGLMAAGTPLFALEWPQYRGPKGDGIAAETLAQKGFPEGGPKEVWKVETSDGFSSFAVGGGKALTLVLREVDGNPMEVCVAYDAANGAELWAAPLWIGGQYGHDGGNSGTEDNKGGDGPRSTPTIDGDKVYAIDAHLRVYCLNLADGATVWSRDLVRENGAQNIKWMNAASPVIDGDKLFVAGGGKGQSLLALNKADGSVIWKGEDDGITHSTPTIAEIHGVKQVIFFTQVGLVSAEAETGKVLWRYDFDFNVSTAISPVVYEDVVYCSAGYNVGGGAVKVVKDGGGFGIEELWRTKNENINHWSTPVVKDGYLYGMFSFKEYGDGPLACVDIKTGEMKWSEAGFGPGNVILSGDQLIVLSDKGEIVLVSAEPDAYQEIAREDVLDGKCWSTPALAGGKVYVRSTKEGGCFVLSGQSVAAAGN